MSTIHYAKLRPREFQQRLSEFPVAYLPLGSLEWHGKHLPLGSDGLQSAGVLERLAEKIGGIVLPMLFCGPDIYERRGGEDYYGMDTLSVENDLVRLPGSAYYTDIGLFDLILHSICKNLARAGFRVVVAHGHGPSTQAFIRLIPQLEKAFGLKLYHLWIDDEVPNGGKPGEGIQTDHAGSNETSLMMALHPHLVDIGEIEGEQGLLGILGKDPRLFASAEAGNQYIDECIARMEPILIQKVREINEGK